MSWGFGGLASSIPTASSQAHEGADLESIETERLGFQALGGDRKVKLLQQSWNTGAYPSKTASLLSIAPSRSLLAVAGPDTLYLYDTNAVRSAFRRDGAGNVEDLAARTQISIPRISHLSFTSDEQALVIAAEAGGLTIYDVNKISNDATPELQIPTNETPIRHLLANPNKEFSHIFAVVTTDGRLQIANLKSQALTAVASGTTTLKENVSCISWSKMGKQIVAGLADGSAMQLDMQGNEKDSIPSPPKLDTNHAMNHILWLENLDFLTIHTSTTQSDGGMAPDAVYHIVHRDKDTKACSFHQFGIDPCPPFLDEQLPSHHFVQRIRDWQPHLDDTLIVACTASTDVGTFTRSKEPLTQEGPADKTTHMYTATSLIDTRRAALPMTSDGSGDTYPIGIALDMSSKEHVKKPIPSDETLDESSTPLPQYCILNQEGYLSAWWFVYNEAVRQGIAPPGLVASSSEQSIEANAAETAIASSGNVVTSDAASESAQGSMPRPTFSQSSRSQSAFGNTNTSTAAFGQPSQPRSTFGQASTPISAFDQPSQPQSAFTQASAFGSAFGKPSQPSAFGQTSFGKPSSPWATTNTASSTGTFGKPSFGASTQLGGGASSFAQLGGMGVAKQSPWGTSASATTASPFAGSAFGGGNGVSPFAAAGKAALEAQKDKIATASPFSAFATPKSEGQSSFASMNENKSSPFAAIKPGMPDETSFGSTVTISSKGMSSFGSGSTFGTAQFGKATETKKEDAEDAQKSKEENNGLNGFSGFKLGTTFKPDNTSAKGDLPVSKEVSTSLFGSGFGDALGAPATQSSDYIKQEPDDDSAPALKDIPPANPEEAAPLPPDFLSAKPATKVEDAPLPPDFITTNTKTAAPGTSDAPLPPDFLSAKSVAGTNDVIPALPQEQEESDEEAEEDDDNDNDQDDEEEDDDQHDLAEDDDDAEWDDEDDEAEDDEGENRTIENPQRLSLFEARLQPASPPNTGNNKKSTTPQAMHKASYTPAGFPRAPLSFVPPRKAETSPRSPSPVRAVTSPVRYSAPTPASLHASVPKAPLRSDSAARTSLFKPTPQPSVVEGLEDEDDRRLRSILEAPIEPSTTLPEFLAHQDYSGGSDKPGIAGQLERVYRDVNSMIDTLGLNARSLQGFLAGHSKSRVNDFDETELEYAEDWVLAELSGLETIQTLIDAKLETGKLKNVGERLESIMEQDQDLVQLRAKSGEVRRQITSRTDPERKAQQQAQPLSQAWASQQLDLRQILQEVQKQMAQAEDALSMLKAELTTAAAMVKPESGHVAIPTVEAVTNTILKMTAMIEKKSGDVDVLEAQIRKLPGGLAALDHASNGDELADSLAASRISNGSYSTPRRGARMNGSVLGMSAMLGSRFQTPTSLRGSVILDPSASVLGRGTASLNGSARKKMSDVTKDEVDAWKSRLSHRRRVLRSLEEAVQGSSAPLLIPRNVV